LMRRLWIAVTLFAACAIAVAQGEVIGEIVVKGLSKVPESTVLATMRSKVGQVYQQAVLNRDKQSIESLGLFQDVKIYGQLLEGNKWRVVVEVVEWPVVSGFHITGNTVFDTPTVEKELEKSGVQKGGVFNISMLDKAAKAISDLYRLKGFFARINKFEPSQVDPTILDVEIVEARVNDIVITGNHRTKPGVFSKLIDTKKGDLLNQKTWSDDLRRIVDTRWFDSIKPDSREPEVGKVDLVLDVQEGRTGMFNVGLQLDPRNKLAGILSVTESNFRGTGKTIGINLMQSAQGLGTSVSLDYGDPFIDNRRTGLSASLYSRQSLVFGGSLFGGGGGGGGVGDETKFSQRRTGGNVSISRVLSKEVRGSFGLKAEAMDTVNFLPDPGEEFMVQDGSIVGFSFGVVRNRRDNSVDPARGDWLKLSVEPSYSNISSVGGLTTGYPILGPNLYSRLVIDARTYFSSGPPRPPEKFDDPRRVFAARLYAGTILGEVPFAEQFFVGGANGIRGYAEDRFWGRHMILTQLEYRHPVQKSFNAVAFVDYGGAWHGYGTVRQFSQSPNFSMHLGYGLGVNFRTPFGPIRLDIGFDDKGQSRTHFTIGSSF
jgi:outer membrane protein insertion porin family